MDDLERAAVSLVMKAAEDLTDEGNYNEALKIIKQETVGIMRAYKGRKDISSLKQKRELLEWLAEATQRIHDKINPDKKKFPVKHQSVRRTQTRKVMRSG